MSIVQVVPTGQQTVPSLKLQYAAKKTLDLSTTFLRDSTATYFDTNGNMVTAGVNEPRFTHTPTEIVEPYVKGLFAAGEQGVWYDPSDFTERLNLLTYTEDFSNAAWVKSNMNYAIGAADPIGGATAITITATSVPAYFYYSSTANPTSGVVLITLWVRRRSGTGEFKIRTNAATFSDTTQTITSEWTWLNVNCVVGTATNNCFVLSLYANGDAVDIWHPGMRLSTNANKYPLYQRVTDAGVADFPGTLFQDAAGTIPVTGMEQPVGKILDKSGKGNHAYQSTPANKPLLSARVNLLTYTEDFSNILWVKGNTSITSNTTIAPNGTLTAYSLTEDSVNSNHNIRYSFITLPMGAVTISIYAKANTRPGIVLFVNGSAIRASAVFDLIHGTVRSTLNLGNATVTSTNITPSGDGWYKCTVLLFTTIGINTFNVGIDDGVTSILANGVAYQGDGTSGIYFWGADLRVTNQGVNLPSYQRVTSAADYDTVGFPKYLKFNGVNQSLYTNSIDFSATDKMTVWAGVRKLSDTALGIVTELSSNISNNGSFLLSAPNSAANNLNFSVKGTSQVDNTVTGYTSPVTNTVTGIASISTPVNTIRVNGVQVSTTAASLGAGNFSNSPLYISTRATGTAGTWLNGNIYSLIIRGAASSTLELNKAETLTNLKTKAY